MIRIAMADDELLILHSLAALVEELEDLSVDLICENGQELIDGLKTQKVDVVLLDLSMPVLNGMDTLEKLKVLHPTIKVIILSSQDDAQSIMAVMEKGANGFLSKTCTPSMLGRAVRSVAETGYYFSEQVSKVMLNGLVQKKTVRPDYSWSEPLSARESEVLQLICKEHTTSEIADQLSLSPRTVEGHRTNILQKTGARNSAGLAVYAMTMGLYDPK